MTESDSDPDLRVRRAFVRGVSTGLAIPAAALSFVMAAGTMYMVPRFEYAFGSVKVSLPVLTEFLFKVHPWPIPVFIVLAMSCLIATALKGERWGTAILNVSACMAGLLWFVILSLAYLGPLMSILHGISTS